MDVLVTDSFTFYLSHLVALFCPVCVSSIKTICLWEFLDGVKLPWGKASWKRDLQELLIIQGENERQRQYAHSFREEHSKQIASLPK